MLPSGAAELPARISSVWVSVTVWTLFWGLFPPWQDCSCQRFSALALHYKPWSTITIMSACCMHVIFWGKIGGWNYIISFINFAEALFFLHKSVLTSSFSVLKNICYCLVEICLKTHLFVEMCSIDTSHELRLAEQHWQQCIDNCF